MEEAEAVSPPSHMSGPRTYYGRCCVAVIGIVLRSDNYLQQTRDMEVALGSGTAGQNDSLVIPGAYVQIVLLPRGARALVVGPGCEPQDDENHEICLLGERCGRFLAVDSRHAMREVPLVSLLLLLLCLWKQIDESQLVLAACGVELEHWQ